MSSIPLWVEEKYPKKIACRKGPPGAHRDALMSAYPEGRRTTKQRENSRPRIYRKDVALTLIEQYGFTLQEVDVGDCVPRSFVLDLTNGEVLVRRGQPLKGTPTATAQR